MTTPEMTTEQAWLLDWFQARGTVPGDDLEGQLATNYFDAGLVESIDVFDLVEDVETHFGIRLDDAHFQDPAFGTIGGLAGIVAGLRSP